ncbi:MAG: hypothetical protein FWD33_01395 [Alphaproteobacteria bacterium]|nr:hypothetical protein [Alphaproteobacteria bacterium]
MPHIYEFHENVSISQEDNDGITIITNKTTKKSALIKSWHWSSGCAYVFDNNLSLLEALKSLEAVKSVSYGGTMVLVGKHVKCLSQQTY